jgi:hypothetical protein
MSRQVPQFELGDYPVWKDMTVVAARTLYYWEERYWLAVLTVDTVHEEKTRRNVQIYRWRWRKDRDGNLRWQRDQQHTINKAQLWEDTKLAVDEMLKYL